IRDFHVTGVQTCALPISQQESASIRVGTEKVDQLINMVGELVITQAMIEQRVDSLDPMLHERLLSSVAQLARNTRDLQEAVMSRSEERRVGKEGRSRWSA